MKNNFKKLIAFFLSCIVILSVFCSCDVYMGNGSETQPVDETAKVEKETVSEIEIKEAFSLKLEELKDSQPAFNRKQKGVMTSAESNWFTPKGIMCGLVSDFDLDGQDEMAVFYMDVADAYTLEYNMFVSIYEYVEGFVNLSDDMLFDAYINTEYIPGPDGFRWNPKLSSEESLIVSTKVVGDKNYIICEHSSISSVYADGQIHDFWLLNYSDEKLSYEASYTQTEGGSNGFEYTGYQFEDGIEDNAQLYCAMNVDEALYGDYDKAVSEFFANYGLNVRNDNKFFEIGGSIFESKGRKEILTFTNKFELNTYNNTYIYTATLSPNQKLEP